MSRHGARDAYDCAVWMPTTAVLVLLALLVAQAFSAPPTFSVVVPGKVITLPEAQWKKMGDPTGFALNFEERTKGPWHEFGRVVTFYLLPMTADRRLGLQITNREYLEFFVVHRGFVTAQTRVDKGKYWVLCRETFRPKGPVPSVDVSTYTPRLSPAAQQQLWQDYQEEIDTTRHLLHSRF